MAKQSFKKEVEHRINDEIIGYPQVRITGDNVESEIVTLSKAKEIASNMELDLVEINAKVTPPILKICNYSKFLYELKKSAKKNKQTFSQVKEIQLTVNIASHDLETKAKQAINFLNHGDKVKVVLVMKGRELTRREENKRSINMFVELVNGFGTVESQKDEGNKTIVILKKNK
jgi:translation initiation factor IF-3